jgi:hypothetical protein
MTVRSAPMPSQKISPSIAMAVMLMGIAGSAAAETSYIAFYRMNEDQQWQVMEDAVRVHVDAARNTSPEKTRCLTEPFTNIMHTDGASEAPLGFRTALSVLNFERDRSAAYMHQQSVEDVIEGVVALYCADPS